MKQYQIKHEGGFTLVELLLAMAVFSFMLLIITAGFINVVRIYQSGNSSRATQQNARLISDGFSKDIRIAAEAVPVESGSGGRLDFVCLSTGNQTTQYAVDSNGDLRVGTIANPTAGTCPAPVFGPTWRTLTDPRTRVTQFNLIKTDPVQTGLGSVEFTLTVVSRNALDLLDTATQTTCRAGSGSQFCAVTTLKTTASLRGGDGS